MAKILLVEDNEMNRDVLSRRLERKGFEVIMAIDGQQGIDMAIGHRPDLILMDLSLPIIDGWEATRLLKADPITARIPIIAVTAHAMAGDRDKAIEAGCDDYDTKPLDILRLVGKIETLLARGSGGNADSVLEEPPPAGYIKSASVSGLGLSRGRILIVDDIEENRDILTRRVSREGYLYLTAENGEIAMRILEEQNIDLVLLDIQMPVMDGFEVLRRMKADTAFRHIPVIVISASTENESVIKGIEMGADDYLPKPFDAVLLKARIGASIEKKKLRDQELVFREQVAFEKKRADDLLNALFPHFVVQELITTDEYRPRRHQNVAVLFSDIVGFTRYCDGHHPEEVIEHLQHLVEAFEEVAAAHRVQKVKTIGDAFMACAGLVERVENPVLSCLECGLAMIERARQIPPHWELRVGIDCGPLVAGIVGKRQYSLDIWGDTVNVASRVEEASTNGRVSISGKAWPQIQHCCRGESRLVEIQGKGQMEIVEFKGFTKTGR